MKSYPKIQHYTHGTFGNNCYAFEKYDGSNFRAEWGVKRGWYKFGTRNVMVDKNTPIYNEAIDIFLNKYGDDLDKVFRNEYKRTENFVVFAEFFGQNSFAGKHVEGEPKDIILFDVNKYKKGMLGPDEFIKNFGHLDIPKIIYQGTYDDDLINDVKSNKYNLGEGVVCKGTMKTKKEGEQIWMSKIKCSSWLDKVKLMYGDSAIIEEFNGDQNILKSYFDKN